MTSTQSGANQARSAIGGRESVPGARDRRSRIRRQAHGSRAARPGSPGHLGRQARVRRPGGPLGRRRPVRSRRDRAIGHRRGHPGRARPAETRRDAGSHHRYLGREVAGLPARLRPQGRHRHSVARILGDSQVTSRQNSAAASEAIDHEAVDAAAVAAFATQYGARATALPPLAVVIAAYNEEGAIGPVVEALPLVVSGLEVAKIVVSDGSADGTVKEADAAGALVCDVPVNRGQGAALRLGYRLARAGGAQYIVTTGQRVTDPSFGLRAMRAEVTGAVSLEQPQYQAAELLIGVLTHGYRVTERPATIHKRKVGQSKKGHNALYGLHFARVIGGTWWRERRRAAAR